MKQAVAKSTNVVGLAQEDGGETTRREVSKLWLLASPASHA